MKQLLMVLAILFVYISSLCAQGKTVKGHQYALKGKIINRVTLPPGCGIMAWATVVELEIISFSDSSYTDKKIGVIFTCPREYGSSFFKVGNSCDIQVADQNQAAFNWTFNNAAVLKKYKTAYWPYVLEAKKVK
jgi:hypothetical protein